MQMAYCILQNTNYTEEQIASCANMFYLKGCNGRFWS